MSAWISVKNRLPPLDKTVMVRWASGFDGSDIFGWGARLDDSEGWLWGVGARWGVQPKQTAQWNDIEADDDYQITHWMPLPRSPVRAKAKQP